MDYADEDGLCATFDELCDTKERESGSIRGRMSRKRNNDDDTREYKSKNLQTERRRREKLSSRLLTLRSLMTKATIIEDAITYIKNLQEKVKSLTQELQEMEASSQKTQESKTDDKIDAAEEMKKCGIQAEVKVTQIDGYKLWVKIIIEKKRGRFKKLVEAMSTFGIELIDTNVTTTKGAFLITTCIQGMNGERLAAHQTQELILDITRAT